MFYKYGYHNIERNYKYLKYYIDQIDFHYKVKSIYDDAVGELAYDRFKDLEKREYEVDFIMFTQIH